MANIRFPEQVLLFVGLLYADKGIFHHVKKTIIRNFGDVIYESSSIPWNYSSYYRDELGWPIFRQFMFFSLFDPGTLFEVKLKTNKIEDRFSVEGKRRVNLDPGYLSLSKVVLASTKNYAHRIYIGKGIYGEVTLIYKSGKYNPHVFTYRDYQDETSINIFMNARVMLKKMLDKLRKSG